MTEQQLDGAHIGALFQQVNGKGVAHGMWCDRLSNAAAVTSSPTRLLNRARADVPVGLIPGKEPSLGSLDAPPLAKNLKQFGGEHDIAIFLSLALLDANDHPLAINVTGLESHGLGQTQARGIAGGQDGAVFAIGEAAEKLQDFLGTENDGQFLGHLGSGNDFVHVPLAAQRYFVKETQSGYGDNAGSGSHLFFLGEMDLVSTDLLLSQDIGRLAKVASELRDVLQVGNLGGVGEIADPHVFDHALSKGCHRKLLCEMECAASSQTMVSQGNLQGTEKSFL
jgi:hypothetical protein